MIRTRRGAVRTLLAVTATLVAVPFGLPGAHAAPASGPPAGFSPVVAETAASGLGSEEGLDRAAAMQRLASQQVRVELGERLVGQLGDKAAGMWLDQDSNAVVVNVVDEQSATAVRAAGAKTQVVSRTMAQLESVQDALTKAQPTDTAIGIDVKANQVVVQVGKAAAGTATLPALMSTVDQFGSAVRVEHVDGSFRTAISGGDPIISPTGGRCSLGFNTTGNTGVTAGHCTASIPQWYDGFTGQYYGPSIHASFPGNDFGLIRNDGGLPQTGWVNLYNGGFQDIVNAADPYPGLYVCKSGSTTGLTCGYVYYVNVTICYPQGCVGGLAQSNAFMQPGDSGGPWFNGGIGVGLSSGIGGGWSFFQPVVEALRTYGIWVF